MAFKISPRFKAGDIKSKSLDTAFLPKYYKAVQNTLLLKTSVDTPTDFFFCQDFGSGEPLIAFGTATATHKKVFREAGKGKNGFDKQQVAMGSCFVLEEDNKRVLCIQPNTTLGKAKEKESIKLLNKMRRQYFKQLHEVRWLKAPLVSTAEGGVEEANEENEETTNNSTATGSSTTDTSTSNTTSETSSSSGQPDTGSGGKRALVSRSAIAKRARELQRGIDKLKNDLMPRYKEQQTTPRDGAFVKAMRKAALVFLTKLTQADEQTKEEFASNKEFLDAALPQWKELERRLGSRANRKEAKDQLKATLQKAVEEMNDIRKEIKGLLKRVRLKNLS